MAGAALLAFLAFYHLSLVRYYSFAMPWAEDLGLFNQALWNLTHYGSLQTTIRPYANILADHFSPIIFVLAPLYYFQASPEWLLLLHTLMLAVSGFLIFLFVRRLIGNYLLALALGVTYFTCFPFQLLATQGVRFSNFSLLFFSLTVFFYVEDKLWFLLLSLMLAAMCQESAPLVVFGFALFAAGQRKNWRWAFPTALVSLAYFWLVFSLVMPRLNGAAVAGGAGFEVYRYLGSNLLGIATSIPYKLPLIWEMLARPHILVFIKELLSPLFYLPLLAPGWLLIPLSQYLIMFLADQPSYANIAYWYFVPVVPFVFAAAAIGLKRLSFDRSAIKTSLAILLLLAPLYSGGYSRLINAYQAKAAPAKLLLVSFLRSIPPAASIGTQTPYAAQLSSRREVYLIGWEREPDYLLLELKGDSWPLSRADFLARANNYLTSGKYELTGRCGEVLLLKKLELTGQNRDNKKK